MNERIDEDTTIRTSWIDIPAADGRAYHGYLALPPARTGPGIVLFQEIFGVNRHIQAVAEQYAQLGFVVLAPDVFWRQAPRESFGYVGDEAARARDMLMRADMAEIGADLEGTVRSLRERPEVTGGVGALGFCIGGRLAYLAAAAGLVEAAACYYGGGIQDQLQKAAAVRCPMLFHYGETDPMIPLAAVERVRAAFTTGTRRSSSSIPARATASTAGSVPATSRSPRCRRTVAPCCTSPAISLPPPRSHSLGTENSP